MGLSKDPEKRERQLAGLRKGQEALAAKLGFAPQSEGEPPAPAKAPAKASPGAKPRPAKARSQGKPRQPPRDDVVDYEEHHAPRQAPAGRSGGSRDDRRRERRGGGFLDGLFGGL